MTLCRLLLPAAVILLSCAPESRSGHAGLYVLPIGEEPGAVVSDPAVPVARVELATTPPERRKGLMFRRSLAQDTGMLFVYPDPAERSFWMKNTLIPLSIAYADESGRIVRILEMLPDPGTGAPLPRYLSGEPAIYALEMERGWFNAHGIREGDRMLFHPSILALSPR